MENNENFWVGKKVLIELSKDGKKLFYTAQVIAIDNQFITFKDKFEKTFCYNRELVKEMSLQ